MVWLSRLRQRRYECKRADEQAESQMFRVQVFHFFSIHCQRPRLLLLLCFRRIGRGGRRSLQSQVSQLSESHALRLPLDEDKVQTELPHSYIEFINAIADRADQVAFPPGRWR